MTDFKTHHAAKNLLSSDILFTGTDFVDRSLPHESDLMRSARGNRAIGLQVPVGMHVFTCLNG